LFEQIEKEEKKEVLRRADSKVQAEEALQQVTFFL